MIFPSAVNLSDWLGGDEPLGIFSFEDAGPLEGAALSAAARKELARLAQAEFFKSRPGECLTASVNEGTSDTTLIRP